MGPIAGTLTKRFERRFVTTLGLAVVALAMTGASIGMARTDSVSNGQHCSNKTLRGTYGIRFQGQKVTGELFAP